MTKTLTFFLFYTCMACMAAAQNNYKEISLPQLMQKAQQGNKGYIILDVRTPGEYVDTTSAGKHIGIGRIKTAINVSLQDLLQKPETIKQLEQYKNEDVYVICSHSYRSRRISNLLLQNGFASVNNVKGGMTEWYRNYDELKPYAALLYENNIAYHNMAPSQFFRALDAKEPVTIIGFNNPPRFFYDSLIAPFYPYFPEIKNAVYYRLADSLQILDKVKTAKGKIVFFNKVGGGAPETAAWLAQKGYNNVYHLVGNIFGFYEYMLNYRPPASTSNYFSSTSDIQFFTPLSYCRNIPVNAQFIDIRHDTVFNQVTEGTKLNYKTLKGAVNFPSYKTAEGFAQQFTDKTKLYMLISEDGYTGIELANTLMKKGYRIGWLLGGIERWEWYTNNIDIFACKDYFIK